MPGVVAVVLSEDKVDKTRLFQLGYKQAPVVVLQSFRPETGEPTSMIATSRKDLNLVDAFGLKSGALFRVSVWPEQAGEKHEEQQQYIIKKLEGLVN